MEPEGKTLLLIDDDARSRESVAGALSRTGYQMFEAESGVAGLTYLENEEIHLVVTDLRMPGMNGVAVFFSEDSL